MVCIISEMFDFKDTKMLRMADKHLYTNLTFLSFSPVYF